MRLLAITTTALILGCSSKFDDNDGGPSAGTEGTEGSEDADADADSDADVDADECGDAPEPGTVGTLSSCEYTPAPSGAAFSARIEWAMTHEIEDPTDGTEHPAYTFTDHPTLDSVFQAPAVGQVTDDDADGNVTQRDIPDIAVIMGNEFEAYDDSLNAYWSAIRVISGDGSAVHATTLWDTYEGVDYAPYLFAGIAMGDVNRDDVPEFATIVRGPDSRWSCWLALYEYTGTIDLIAVSDTYVPCSSHAPAFSDMEFDGTVEILLGDTVYDGETLTKLWDGGLGTGSFNLDADGTDTESRPGYWNSGYHSFAYDMDGDGSDMELVAGNTVYNNDGSVYCELMQDGTYTADGYPAVADIIGDDGKPEIVISGNHWVAIYDGQPNGSGHCELIAANVNKPEADAGIDTLPSHPDCREDKSAFGGQPTVADFTGDGDLEIGVAGSCWYSVYKYDSGSGTYLDRYALTQTRDWSSASTGATVFDFNGDGAREVVFSDEDAVYVWWIDDSAGLDPWERMVTLLEDTNHKSWTIHEYPLVADVDGDGKAEILAVNSHLSEDGEPSGHYGIYVLGAADDDWVSARSHWNQHAYYITNISEAGNIGYAPPNYAPFTAADYNSFRTQAPGSFGALAASNLYPVTSACQDECGPLTVWVQGANESPYIGAREDLPITLYGISGSTETYLDEQPLPWRLDAGDLSKSVAFEIDADVWSSFEKLLVVIDEPDGTSEWGGAHECDESDNERTIDLSDFCP